MNKPPIITITANGASADVGIAGPMHGSFTGAFGGASITIEASLDGGATWAPDVDTEFDSARTFALPHVSSCRIRAQTTGATGSTNVALTLRPIV